MRTHPGKEAPPHTRASRQALRIHSHPLSCPVTGAKGPGLKKEGLLSWGAQAANTLTSFPKVLMG